MLFCVCGKSCTGKDTLCELLLADEALRLHRLTLHTTRPIRAGEADGKAYHFVTAEQMEDLGRERGFVERREYLTVHGAWVYATLRGGALDEPGALICVATPAALRSYIRTFGGARVCPLYVETPDKERLLRAVERESRADAPSYGEVCRRYLADEADFSPQALADCGIKKRYLHADTDVCAREMREAIRATVASLRPRHGRSYRPET
ncbi:MAG: guanylate kinase [Oscillospiraceae bacterium]|jgi:guanylate kinase|nr:guanylate kinase [Oscillospiraceae bacterium]